MKYQCEMIQDLLPLYQDNVCSDESKRILEEHLEECNDCRIMAAKLKNTKYDVKLHEEREGIIDHHVKQVKKNTFITGAAIAGVLTIPIIVCLICNLAIGHALDWFFIVLASLLVFASITVVPLMIEKKKALWTLACFTVSLMLLLLTCSIYSKGDWFLMAAVPIIFGLTVIFLPYVLYTVKLPKVLSRQKGLICMLTDTVLLFAVILCAGIFSDFTAVYWGNAFLITLFAIVYPWLFFVILRYTKMNGYCKAGTILVITGIYTTFFNDVVDWILDGANMLNIMEANLFHWTLDTLNANISLLILITFGILGIIFFITGIARNKK